MSYQPTPYDEIEFLLVMMGFLFLKGPEIDLTDLPKIGTRYFCIFGTLEYLKTQKYRRIHENRTEIHSDVHYYQFNFRNAGQKKISYLKIAKVIFTKSDQPIG